jgi:HEAT repeat protein
MTLDNTAINALISTLNDKFIPNEVRAGAARGLGHAGGAAARGELLKIMEDRFAPADVRAAAAEALGHAAHA